MGSLAAGIATTLGIGFVMAALQWVALKRSRTLGIIATIVVIPIILLSPLTIPSSERLARFLLATASFSLAAKLFDILHPQNKELPKTIDWVRFILNPSLMVYRRQAQEPRPSRAENVRRLRRGLVQAALGLGACVLVWRYDQRLPFILEHSLKVPAFFVTLLGLIDVVAPVVRLAGGTVRDPFHDIFAARTPAELWRRYNRIVGQWFEADFFNVFGGRRHPVRATLLVFVLSSIIHEYIAWIAIGKLSGWQTVFFMIHGIGVALTLRLKPRGSKALLGVAGMIFFDLATAVFFFDAVNKTTRFYAGPGVL